MFESNSCEKDLWYYSFFLLRPVKGFGVGVLSQLSVACVHTYALPSCLVDPGVSYETEYLHEEFTCLADIAE